jgi:hypothetical protein
MSFRRDPWFENALLLGVLGLLVCVSIYLPARQAQAAGGGWETDNIIALAGGAGDRVVIIDTVKKNMCIYKLRGVGEFRLVGARSFQYDVEFNDTSQSDMEKNGWTYHEVRKVYETQIKGASK